MTPTVVLLALAAAASHATWNAFLRSGADRLKAVTIMGLAMVAAAVPVAAWMPLPGAEVWPFLLLSACLQVSYSLFLVTAYRHGGLGQVYPVVRGSVPLLVTLGGLAFGGQHLGPFAALGVGLVAAGIMGLSSGAGRTSSTALLWALAAGALIACYTTVDAVGVRTAGDPLVYTAWINVLYGAFLPAVYLARRGRLDIDLTDRETWWAAAGGLVSLGSYGLVVAALALGPAGPVSALRETSVVFAALIGRLFLGESLTRRRLAMCLTVAAGAVCIGLR